MQTLKLHNNQSVPLVDIPILDYIEFMEGNTVLSENPDLHCVNYFGFQYKGKIRLICCIADDSDATIHVSSSIVDISQSLPSFTKKHLSFHVFERELAENFNIRYTDHPWLKPIRYPFDRADRTMDIANYPFYRMESEELHEVAVGPIHAGIIEPGHFRFICNGEQILHLEIQLGFQHRGIERLLLEKKKLLQRVTLAESIAGDTVAGHTITFSKLWESLCDFHAGEPIQYSRILALELERIAIHTGDLSALCNDVGYQFGSSVFGRLRTPVINFTQAWCGNRLGKGLIRTGRDQYPFTYELADRLMNVLDTFEPDFEIMCRVAFRSPTVQTRFEKTGMVTANQMYNIGAVGMAAKTVGIKRDIRNSHPDGFYEKLHHKPIIKHHGDVYSRVQLRREEINQSIGYIRKLCKNIPLAMKDEDVLKSPGKELFGISLTEGWRGEICHCAITDSEGELICYKVKDPSLHNWLALALCVRNNEISDFPLCNKSFNLSYSGNDL